MGEPKKLSPKEYLQHVCERCDGVGVGYLGVRCPACIGTGTHHMPALPIDEAADKRVEDLMKQQPKKLSLKEYLSETCPECGGDGRWLAGNSTWTCNACDGTGRRIRHTHEPASDNGPTAEPDVELIMWRHIDYLLVEIHRLRAALTRIATEEFDLDLIALEALTNPEPQKERDQ